MKLYPYKKGRIQYITINKVLYTGALNSFKWEWLSIATATLVNSHSIKTPLIYSTTPYIHHIYNNLYNLSQLTLHIFTTFNYIFSLRSTTYFYTLFYTSSTYIPIFFLLSLTHIYSSHFLPYPSPTLHNPLPYYLYLPQ